jgi:hypothetical protein
MTDTAVLRELLRRAVLTMFVVPDGDRRYRSGLRTAWPKFVQHQRDAYGSAPPRVKMFEPTRRDLTVYLEVLSWLAWYQRAYGEETVNVFIWWCRGAAMWSLQERVSTNRRRPCSPQTVRDHMRGMFRAIDDQFHDAVEKIIDESGKLGKFAAAQLEDAELSSDLRTLPQTPKTWRAAPDPLPPADQASAHMALEKRLRRNGSRALKRAGK